MEKALDSRIEVRANDGMIKEIDLYAEKLGITRSKMVRNIVQIGLDDIRIMRRFGILSLVQFVRENSIKPKQIIDLAKNEGCFCDDPKRCSCGADLF